MATAVLSIEFCNVRVCRVMFRCHILDIRVAVGCFTLCICRRPVARSQARNSTKPLRICARRLVNFADRFVHLLLLPLWTQWVLWYTDKVSYVRAATLACQARRFCASSSSWSSGVP